MGDGVKNRGGIGLGKRNLPVSNLQSSASQNKVFLFVSQAMVPLKSQEGKPENVAPKEATALQIEHDTLQEVMQLSWANLKFCPVFQAMATFLNFLLLVRQRVYPWI